MGKGMEGIVGVNTEFLGGDEHRTGGTERDIAASLADHTGSHRGGRIVTGTGTDNHILRQAQRCCHLGLNRTDCFKAFKKLRR